MSKSVFLPLAIGSMMLAAMPLSAMAQDLTRQQMRDVRAACEEDMHRLCNGVKPGGGKLLQCMQNNSSSISQMCLDTLVALKAVRDGNPASTDVNPGSQP